jgi:uncharacterized protein (UPF0264 family)
MAAIAGGAGIIDVKEPASGPLGSADPSVWRDVRRVVPAEIPLSVALGEAAEWQSPESRFPSADDWRGVSFAKLGLAGSGSAGLVSWPRIRERFERDFPEQVAWVAVIYADWHGARAPFPDEILHVAVREPRCAGVLVDTWSKSSRPTVDLGDGWRERIELVHSSGRFFAWAGGMGLAEIAQLGRFKLTPDIIAVRGSACRNGDRLGHIDSNRVRALRDAASRI